jgi:uncharacterized protein DUF2844
VKRLLMAMVGMCQIASAQAYLGGNTASVEADRVHMKAQQAARVTQPSSGAYTIHETTLATGTIVRQYVSSADVVFAVTWSGPFKPDLRQLLGVYFDTMVARQAGQVHVGHPFVSQHAPDLVVESSGHPRSFFGRAYLPGAVPSGITPAEIQ